MMTVAQLVPLIQRHLTDDLLLPKYLAQKQPSDSPLKGHCYVACETLYHLSGGKRGRLLPHVCQVPDGSGTHWWLVNRDTGAIVDPTAAQFSEPKRLYAIGRRGTFLTKPPSRRSQQLINLIKQEYKI